MNFFNNYICALDISTSKIAAVLAKLKRNNIQEIFFEEIPAKGIKQGNIIDSIEFGACLEEIILKLKKSSGLTIKGVYANITGEDIITKHSKAIIPLADRGNKVITPADIRKVNEQARILGSSLEEEIIDQMPFGYSIDTKENIYNPLGLYSHRLEVDLYLICAKLSNVQTFTRAINQAGLEVKNLFFSALAVAEVAVEDKKQQGTFVFCDCGSDITEIVVFSGGLLCDVSIIMSGGNVLTEELSNKLNIPFELAEEIKRSYASIQDTSFMSEAKEVLIKKESMYRPIKQKEMTEIVTLKSNELISQIKGRIEKIIPLNKIDSIIISGRTALLEGFLESFENKLNVPVKLARISNKKISEIAKNLPVLSGQKHLDYLTALGILLRAMEEEQPKFSLFFEPGKTPIASVLNKVKEIYQEYF